MLASAILTTTGHLAKLSGLLLMTMVFLVVWAILASGYLATIVVAIVYLDNVVDIKSNFPTSC